MNDTFEIVNGPLGIVSEVKSEPLYKLYKLRQISTGQYSSGTDYTYMVGSGKEWKTLRTLSGHLTKHGHPEGYRARDSKTGNPVIIPWNDMEIVVLEVHEADCMDAQAYMVQRRR